MTTLLVTGAGGAIGTATVQAGLRRGYAVVAQDISESVLAHLPSDGVTRAVGDLTSQDGIAHVVEACGDRLDAAVVAHGVAGAGAFEGLDEDTMRFVMRVNAASIPPLFSALLDLLVAARGAFVAIASQAALRGEPANSIYAASKWAVRGWVEGIAPAMAERGVNVRALCPGRTESPLLDTAQRDSAAAMGVSYESFVRDRLAEIPVGRFAKPEEMATVALYLADPDPRRPTVLAATGGEVTF
jgi:NAD(P)-dependent dehydrogenase (short-subunit alcohol dehydrogenase family)